MLVMSELPIKLCLRQGAGEDVFRAVWFVLELMKESNSKAPAFSYSQCCCNSVCANLCCLSFPNATLKQREEICDVANVTLVWVGAALISAVQKYFCQLHIFPCWALHFCFAVHVASCPVEKPFSLQKHPPCWCLLEAFCATLGTPLVFSMAVEMHR